ncbi:MAG: dihydropteroate synthase [Bacteroidetes bacterium 4484_276]|nr:MAG: dihydropteroate synthase [Bacteroidetes bacterium 4484_276]
MHQLKWKDKHLNLSHPAVMGVLNLTPDSFYDGGKYGRLDDIIRQAEKMIEEGTAIIDLGAVSTRPNSTDVLEEEEWNRLKAVLPALRKRFPDTLLSVDTYRASIARASADLGTDIINDISGGRFDEKMFATIAKLDIPYVMMHIKGTPATMQQNPVYDDVVIDICNFFDKQLKKLAALGVTKNIILDPGFGFGKTVEHNFELLQRFSEFKKLEHPLLAGLSRKSMINKVLGIKPENALNGTTVLNTIALLNDANILRVHDVKEAVEAVKLVEVVAGN